MFHHNLQRGLFCIAIITLIYSCSSIRTKVRGEQIVIENNVEYRDFYLLGNLIVDENTQLVNLNTAVDYIKSNAREEDFTLLLGDNVEAEALNRDDDDKADLDNFKKQLNLFQGIAGSKYVIPGDHDWNDEGIQGLKNIEKLVEDQWGNDEAFQPENACPIEDIDISDTMHLFIVDSQWYIADWDDKPLFNDECEINTRELFLSVLKDELRKQRHKTVIVAIHHPVYSNGLYGGRIADYNLYKPSIENAYLPVVGAPWSFLRSQGGISRQDRFNPLMNELMEEIKTMTTDHERVIFVSAHENNLQYIDDNNRKQIVSGSLHKSAGAALGKKGKFATGKAGFSRLRVYRDLASTVTFYEIEDGVVKEVYENSAFAKADTYPIASIPKITAKSISSSVYKTEETIKDQDYTDFYGAHYRDLYGLKVDAPVVMLDTLYGGMKVERAGGGNQTQGLRLVDSLDREFNMRALEKDALQFLKSAGYDKLDADTYFAETLPQELVRDFYTAAHPYGAFAVPRLAGAIDLNHTHPKLFYVPKQEVLGDFNETHGDRLYMIVEKPDDSFNSNHMFGYNEDVESTGDLFEKLREDEKNTVDERLYIRARIFDMLLGDWDRHEDQWRWAQVGDPEDEDKHTFVAIPRDRDQVFARFDGKLLDFLRKFVSSTRQFGVYGPDIPHIKQFSQSAINLDRAILQRSDLRLWQEEVEYIQNHISPEIVSNAFNEMPDEVKNELWEQTQQDLIARKANLPDIVNRYFEQFLEFQTLKGTDKDDHFIITRLPDGVTRVEAYRIKDGEKGTQLFHRTFDAAETTDLWIYGLDDDDIFEIKGEAKGKFLAIAIAGGKGKDSYIVENGKKIKIYDYRSEENEVGNHGAFVVLRDDYDINHYDPEKNPKRSASIAIKNEYDPDLGYVPTLNYIKTIVGYEANPYSRKYGMGVQYHSLTQAAIFTANAGLSNVVGHWNLELDAKITTNNYTENFFGFGNNTSFDADTDFDINRVFLQRKEVRLALDKMGDYGSHFNTGLEFQNIEVEQLDSQEFLNAFIDYNYRSIDHERFTTHGLDIALRTKYTDELSSNQQFFNVDPALTFWNAIDRERKLVLKTTIAGQLRIGDDPQFFQAARLGANRGLRSYRMDRFTGDSALNASADILYDFNALKTRLLPLNLSAFTGIDVGKVWWQDESSDEFHLSYGGGLQFSMSGLFKADISYFHGDEGGRLQLGLRFSK
jgi:predicted phosphohydrolase